MRFFETYKRYTETYDSNQDFDLVFSITQI